MIYVVSRFNHKISWLKDYANKVYLYDRSPIPEPNSIIVPNVGTDIYDKLTFIIDNYNNLPDVAVYTKANLFDYIKPREFEKICNNTTFTPILSQEHHTYMPVCFYKDGMYNEKNDEWYLSQFPCKNKDSYTQLVALLDAHKREYNAFAPGSNYILPRETILKYPKSFYEKLRSFLDWTIYPGEAQLIERNLYYIWK